jgi:hypothetical protein
MAYEFAVNLLLRWHLREASLNQPFFFHGRDYPSQLIVELQCRLRRQHEPARGRAQRVGPLVTLRLTVSCNGEIYPKRLAIEQDTLAVIRECLGNVSPILIARRRLRHPVCPYASRREDQAGCSPLAPR